MLNSSFIHPSSIAVIGGSEKIHKPGGKIVHNLLHGRFQGELHVVNPKLDHLDGCICHKGPQDIKGAIDLGIISLPSELCKDAIRKMNEHAGTDSFIIISAGFSEIGEKGRKLEKELVEYCYQHKIQVIGPNCIGLLSPHHSGVFTTPIPDFDPHGVDLVSASGATAVFLLEEGLKHGLTFHSIYSVGNGLMIRVEDVLEYLDTSFDANSAKTKLLYLESIYDPVKFHKHCRSLIDKGCRIAAIKAGRTAKGIEAASSHTAAISNPDDAIASIFSKAGIIRCYSRKELTSVGMLLQHKELKGWNMGVITHAGGPGVMLSDHLSDYGFDMPTPGEKDQEKLLINLHPGSSVHNPFDILATGREKELSGLLDYTLQHDDYDAIVVIYGSPGLFPEDDIFKLIKEYQVRSTKPIYTIIPSLHNASREMDLFKSLGGIFWEEEYNLAKGLSLIKAAKDRSLGTFDLPVVHGEPNNEFIPTEKAMQWLTEADIPLVDYGLISHLSEADDFMTAQKRNVVLKALDLHHKTDKKAVFPGLAHGMDMKKAMDELREISEPPYLIQEQLSGHEVYLGIKRYDDFGWMLYLGEGGVNLTVRNDIVSGLLPLHPDEIRDLIDMLSVKMLWQGHRGQKGIDLELLVGLIKKLEILVQKHPDIRELDINPLIAIGSDLKVVDVRILV